MKRNSPPLAQFVLFFIAAFILLWGVRLFVLAPEQQLLFGTQLVLLAEYSLVIFFVASHVFHRLPWLEDENMA